MIEVKHLTKRYGDHLALDDVSFTVEDGEIVGFLGPNGAGKSTTMNIITGYLSSTDGEVLVDGVDVLENPIEAKKKIGYLPEIPPLYGDMTVKEYLEFACDLKKIPAANKEETIEQVSKLARVTDVKGRLIRNLSKGYKQRVGLAQAMIGNPEVLILDEPTVGLDPKQIIEVRDLVKNLSKDHTILLSSHILQEVQAVCDKLVIINHGRIVAIDSPEELSRNALQINKLELRIKGPKNEILRGISELTGVENAELLRVREEGTVDIRVETDETIDVREEIFEFCRENDFPIFSMKTDEVNLEDIFLQVTGEREAKR
ncbi:MAG: ATP-binding cassette domain-containing protein [Lachnospiraceae bacterium]|nr:ATP-binding cassette domain-containing protein [Lachnospiraceae bacterium]